MYNLSDNICTIYQIIYMHNLSHNICTIISDNIYAQLYQIIYMYNYIR